MEQALINPMRHLPGSQGTVLRGVFREVQLVDAGVGLRSAGGSRLKSWDS